MMQASRWFRRTADPDAIEISTERMGRKSVASALCLCHAPENLNTRRGSAVEAVL